MSAWISAQLLALSPPALAQSVRVEIDCVVREQTSGDPIKGASLRAGVSSVTTDARGRAILSLESPIWPVQISVSADGFADQNLEIASEPDKLLKIWLTAGGTYEVVVEGLKRTADPSRHSVDGEMALETPGTLDDSVRLVQSLPGVTVQREYSPSSGDLSVRGSSPGDSRYYLDGVEIPYLYHFNQYASVFPSTQIEQLELYPSTFSSRYGDAVGAIVEAESRLEPPEAVHGGGHLNFVMAGADLTAPLPKRWWFSASGRRSYQDLAGEGSAQYTVWPTFYDFSLRAEHGDAEDGTGIFALGAGDSYTRAAGELDVLDPLEVNTIPYLDYQQGFQVIGTRRHFSTEHLDGRIVGALVHHQRQGDLSGLGSEHLDTLTLTSRLDTNLRATERWGADLGYEINAHRVGLVVDDAGSLGVRVAEESPALARGVSVDDEMLRLRAALYGTARADEGPVSLMPGLRVAGDSTSSALQLEPRATARWAVSEGTMLKLGGGRYTQRPDSELLFEGTGDPLLPTTRSWQVSAGIEQAFAGRLEVGLDLYRKWLRDPLLSPIDAPPYAVPSGDAWGFELLTRYRLRERFFLWGWLAVQRTTLDESSGVTIPANGDQILSGGIVSSFDVGRFNFGGRYRYASGLPFTPIESSLYDAGNDTWFPLPGATNSDRLPNYHKVDLRAAYTIVMKGWTLSFSAELWMVPRSSAQLYPIWNYNYSEQGFVLGPTFLPLLGARARF